MSLHSINHDQGLYVLRCGDGFSCLGFEVCERRSRGYARYLGLPPPRVAPGTPEAYRRYEELLGQVRQRFAETGVPCDAELTPQLVGLEGKRVEVVDRYGESRQFTVGRSTGWIPCHLELDSDREIGGCAVTGAPFRSLVLVERGVRRPVRTRFVPDPNRSQAATGPHARCARAGHCLEHEADRTVEPCC